jgi:UDP-glucose 4-epimerase
VVVHAAASYHDPNDWEEDVRTNIQGSTIVTQASLTNGVHRLIYFQTALCYGLKPLEQPITVGHPLFLEGSSYAISKTAGERYIAFSGIDYISFRLANAYGPRNISGPLPIFFQRLSQGKDCFVVDTRRDFIFVADLVDCAMKAIDGVGAKGVYHIASGNDFAIEQLFDATVDAMGLDPRPGVERRSRSAEDAATILLDPSKTQRDFDWQVTTGLAKGVPQTISYYRQFGIRETYTHLKHDD